MSPSVVQSARNAGTGTSVTVSLGSPTTPGNCLVALVATAASTNGSVSGITLGGAGDHWAVEDSEGTGSDHAIVTCWSDPSCAGSQTSVVISTTGSTGTQTIMAWVFEVSGMPSSGPLLDKSAKLSSAGFVSSWSLGPTATTTQASEVWFGIAAGNVSGVTPGTYTGPGAPWSNEPNQGVAGASFSFGGVAGSQVVSSTGTASYNGSVTPSSTIEGLVVALHGASGGTAHTATASLTVTPSFTASRRAGRFRSASLSVTPALTASRTRGRFRAASLTVAPSFAASRAHGHARQASLLVAPSFAAQRVMAHVRSASLLVTPSFRAVPSGGVAKLERQLVRLAVAAYFGGNEVTSDAGVCFQGGPLTSFGLGTAYPYTVRGVPDEYYTAGMPDGQNWGCVLSTTSVRRRTTRDSYGGKTSGWRARAYTIECEIALICELPHIEAAGAGLDDLIDEVHALIYADRTLGTNGAPNGVQIIQAGEGRAGIEDVTGKFAALDEVKGRYAAEATVTFEALTMVEG